MSELDQSFKALTLKGSAEVVKECLYYAIHSILYQKGYGPLNFYKQNEAYGLNLFVSEEPTIERTINKWLANVEKLLVNKEMINVKVNFVNSETTEIFESWKFHIEYENGLSTDSVDIGTKDSKEVKSEICSVLRQIMGTASVLPPLDKQCDKPDLYLEIQWHTMTCTPVPKGWYIGSDDQIENPEEIPLRSFSTSIHHVSGKVQYKNI